MSVICLGGDHVDRRILVDRPPQLGQSIPVQTVETAGGVAANVARALWMKDHFADLRSVDVECAYTVVEHAPTGEVLFGFADTAGYEQLDDAWLSSQKLSPVANLVVDGNCNFSCLPAGFQGRLFLVAVSPAKMERFLPVLGESELLFCNSDEAKALEKLGALPSARLVTHGVEGATLTLSDGQSKSVKGLDSPPKTETGMGDLLAGFMIAALLDGTSPFEALDIAMKDLADATL